MDKNILVNFRVDSATKQAFDAVARKNQRPIAAELRLAMQNHIQANESKGK